MKRGFYYINTKDDIRCYYLTGEKKGNKWIYIGCEEGIVLDGPEWCSLLWTCLPKEEDLKNATFHETNPTEYKLN